MVFGRFPVLARFAHTATLLQNGKVLVTGGCTASNCSPDTAVSELYDPTSNSWSTTGNLNTARAGHTAVRLKTGTVLAVGGSPGLASCELYDPTKGTWTNAASTNAGRYLSTATLLPDGKVLVAGGANLAERTHLSEAVAAASGRDRTADYPIQRRLCIIVCIGCE
jgi:N-acetylneuraminic acid mutarotase